MGALVTLSIIALVIVLIGLIRVGLFATYSNSGFKAWLRVGPISIQIYPTTKKVGKATVEKTKSKEKPEKAGDKKQGGSFEQFKSYFNIAKDALSEFVKHMQIGWLRVDFVAASKDDPANAAILYGAAWSLAGIITPHLENNNGVKQYAYNIELDFSAECATIYSEADVSFSIGRVVILTVKYGLRLFADNRRHKKGRIQHGKANS